MGKSKKTQKQENALITQFVEDCFDRYYLSSNVRNIFKYDKNDYRSLPLFKNGEVSEDILNRSAKFLGMTTQELLNCDKEAARRWDKKFRFFALYRKFIARQIQFYNTDEIYTKRLIKAIFGKETTSDYKEKESAKIYQRMIDVLKAFNEKLPNSYNSEDEIIDFAYETDQFFSFPQIGELIGSFSDLVNRAKELFFKAWNEDLNEQEKKEYDFLVTFLGIVDNYVPHKIYYENLKQLIPVYREEGFKGEKEEFLNLVHLKFCYSFSPWSCREFSENFDIAQLYASIYPYAKRKMFDFGSSVKYYDCRFKQGENDIYDQEDIEELELYQTENAQAFIDQMDAEIEQDIAELDAFEQNGMGLVFGWIRVRVPKTSEELNGDEKYAEKLIRLGGAISKGGVRIPNIMRKYGQEEFHCIHNRISVWGRRCDE